MSQKPDRPFAPGAFASESDDESTRVAPLDTTSAGRQRVRPAAGMMFSDESAMRGAPPPAAGSSPMFGQAPPMMPPPQHGYAPPGYPPQQPYGAGYGAPPPSFGSLPAPPGPNFHPMGAPPAGAAPGTESALAKWKALPVPRKILVVLAPFALASAGYMLLADPPEPANTRSAKTSLDAGPNVQGAASGAAASEVGGADAATVPPVAAADGHMVIADWPEDVPCPPIGWPADRPAPCEPNNAPIPAGALAGLAGVETADPRGAAAGGPTPAATTTKGKDTTTSASNKTLERQAVDAFALGRYDQAADLYDQLLKQAPENRAFAEASRIAHMHGDAGVP